MNVHVVVRGQVKSENSSLPVTVRVSKTRMLKLPIPLPLWSLSGHVPLPSLAFLYRFVYSFGFVPVQLFSIAFYWTFQLFNGFSGREKIAKASGITFRLLSWHSFASSSWISRTSKTSWSRCDRRQLWRNATCKTSKRKSRPGTPSRHSSNLKLGFS